MTQMGVVGPTSAVHHSCRGLTGCAPCGRRDVRLERAQQVLAVLVGEVDLRWIPHAKA